MDVNTLDEHGHTALLYACLLSNEAMVELLISKKADVTRILNLPKGVSCTITALAKSKGNSCIIKLLQDAGGKAEVIRDNGDPVDADLDSEKFKMTMKIPEEMTVRELKKVILELKLTDEAKGLSEKPELVELVKSKVDENENKLMSKRGFTR